MKVRTIFGKRTIAGALALGLLLAILLLNGCEVRQPDTGGGASSTQDASQAVEDLDGEDPEMPQEPLEPDYDTIDDPEMVADAREIVEELLQFAAVCGDIYQGNLTIDNHSPRVPMETIEYALVLGQFETMEDVQAWLDKTFDMSEERPAKFFKDIQEANLYRGINGELYMRVDTRRPKLTMGDWDTDTFSLLEMNEEQMVVRMQTTLAGQDNGAHNLTVRNNSGKWLLGDSYFLD